MAGQWKKRLPYWAFLLVITIVIVEFSPYVVSPILYRQSYSRSATKQAMAEVGAMDAESAAPEDGGGENEYLGNHILHPYLGFVGVPSANYNRFCFPGPDPITQASEDTVNVCVYMYGDVHECTHIDY